MPKNYLVPRTRERDLNIHHRISAIRRKNGEIVNQAYDKVYFGGQKTVSEDHKRSPNGKFYAGGPFYSARVVYDIPTVMADLVSDKGKATEKHYSGVIYTRPGSSSGQPVFPSEDSKYLDPYGATAISLVNPGNPNAQAGTAIGEIARDGLPIPGISLWRERASLAKAAGSEYLNAVFGWVPLLSDIEDTVESIRTGNVILKNYHDNSGRNVHREFQFDDEISESESIVSENESAVVYGGLTNGFNLTNSERGPLTAHTKTVVRRWFSGTFTYQANSDNDSFRKMLGYNSDADKLFGLTLTPDVVWELTPWSWAVDWFSNAGNVIQNFTDFVLAGTVMRYGYIMEETTTKTTYSLQSAGLQSYAGSVPPSSKTITVKRRREANPFGFGLSWEGLSPTQLAITAALGITRLR